MFKIYKRTVHIGTSRNRHHTLEYKVEELPNSGFAKRLAIPALIAGAVVGTLVFSVLLAALLIPLAILGFKTWRLPKTAHPQGGQGADGDSITAEYSVVSEPDKK